MKREGFKQFWLRLFRWPGWTAWIKWEGWKKIAHWNGWTAWVKWPGWKKIGSWQGWKRMLFPHPAIVMVLTALSAAGLAWVFLTGNENSIIAYPLYCVSFYALMVLVALFAQVLPKGKKMVTENRMLLKLTGGEKIKFSIGLYVEQFVNLCYGFFKLIVGVLHASTWLGADGLYNLLQGVMQLYQVLRRKKVTTLMEQWKSYRLCGWLTIVMHLPMTGLVLQMIFMGEHKEYPGYMIFATAAFTFYKLIHRSWDVAKDRGHERPVDSAVRLLDLSQALYNLFVLQVALLWEFGSEDFTYHKLMNSLTGSAVCLLVVAMGIYMLYRSKWEIRKLEEENG